MADSIPQRRLAAQRLAAPSLRTPAAVVSWLGAVQAQDYLGALWAVGLRMKNATESQVEGGLADGSIVRTWPMRGTLHFVAAADVRWMLALLAPRVMARHAKRLKQEFDLGPAVFAKAEKVIVKALLGGRQLQREALYQLLDDAGIDTSNQRGLHLVFLLAHQQLLCFGAREGKQQTFRLLDEWVPMTRAWTREESLAEVAHRYFTSHGPATMQDFAWWSGLTAADAREALALAPPTLHNEQIGGREYWFGDTSRARADTTINTWLLPAYDEYTVAYKDRGAILDPAHRRLAVTGYGLINPAIVRNGLMLGTWKRALSPSQVVVTPLPFAPMRKAEAAALLPAARRYGNFLEVPAVLRAR